jgi:hypothetical protein
MERYITLAIVAFLALAVLSCSDTPTAENHSTETRPLSSFDSTVIRWQAERKAEEDNRLIAKSQEIPTGEVVFQKVVAYIWEHGEVHESGQYNLPYGREYLFVDSKGNSHRYAASKRDSIGEVAIDGKVRDIVVYAFLKGIKDSEHFFAYHIDTTSVYCPTLTAGGTWKGVEEATLGYTEFLAKVSKETPNQKSY